MDSYFDFEISDKEVFDFGLSKIQQGQVDTLF
jgi:hypothetical protein